MHLGKPEGKPCQAIIFESFPDGITNGAAWYSVTGGMQDWNYNAAGIFEITLELGCFKFPFAADLPNYWKENREPLVKYIEQIHRGVHGFIKSSIGTAVKNAAVTLNRISHVTRSTENGEYWKLATPGKYNISVVAPGFAEHYEEIDIADTPDGSTTHDISLMRDDPQHWSSANDYRILENVLYTRYIVFNHFFFAL